MVPALDLPILMVVVVLVVVTVQRLCRQAPGPGPQPPAAALPNPRAARGEQGLLLVLPLLVLLAGHPIAATTTAATAAS